MADVLSVVAAAQRQAGGGGKEAENGGGDEADVQAGQEAGLAGDDRAEGDDTDRHVEEEDSRQSSWVSTPPSTGPAAAAIDPPIAQYAFARSALQETLSGGW
jgi:hypothetical protein